MAFTSQEKKIQHQAEGRLESQQSLIAQRKAILVLKDQLSEIDTDKGILVQKKPLIKEQLIKRIAIAETKLDVLCISHDKTYNTIKYGLQKAADILKIADLEYKNKGKPQMSAAEARDLALTQRADGVVSRNQDKRSSAEEKQFQEMHLSSRLKKL